MAPFDEEDLERPVRPPHLPHLEFDDNDFKQYINTEPDLLRGQKKELRRGNPGIDSECSVYGNASGIEETNDENDDLD